MSRAGGCLNDLALPCVHLWYNKHERLSTVNGPLSYGESHDALIKWFAYMRSEPSDIEQEEYSRCPLKLCRESRDALRFETLLDNVHHISMCLVSDSSAHYWCPSCRRYEDLVTNNVTSPSLAPGFKVGLVGGIGTHLGDTEHPDTFLVPDVPSPATFVPQCEPWQTPWRINEAKPLFGNLNYDASVTAKHESDSNHTPTLEHRRYAKSDGFDLGRATPSASASLRFQQLRSVAGPTKGYDCSGMIAPLCGRILALDDIWQRTIAKDSSLQERVKSRFVMTRSILEDGLLAVQKCFGVGLPSTFAEIFPILHVVVASMNILYQDDNTYDWNALAEDMMRWGQLIHDDSDRDLYGQVLQLLDTSKVISSHAGHMDQNHATPAQFRHPVRVTYNTTSELWQVLKQGRVLGQFVELLDELEYAVIAQRDPRAFKHPHFKPAQISQSAKKINAEVLKPLQRMAAYSIIGEDLNDIRKSLEAGILLHPHDVEVALIRNTKDSFDTPQQFEGFRRTLRALFDGAMRDKNWRNRYHAITIVHTLTVAVELNNQHMPSTDLLHPINTSKTLQPDIGTLPSLLVSPSSFDNASEYVIQQIHSSMQNPSNASPLSLSQASSPGSNIDLASSNNEWQHCCFGHCAITFSGKSADRRKNFYRHIEEQHGSKVYPCTFPGCEKEYKGERNLHRHMRNKAHTTSSVETGHLWPSQSRARQRALSNDGLGSLYR